MAFPNWSEMGISIRDIRTAVEKNESIHIKLERKYFDFLKGHEQQLKDLVRRECGEHGDLVSSRIWLHEDKEDRTCTLRTLRVNIPEQISSDGNKANKT